MKHLGDILKISGYNAPVVNVVIGGSPCQDLSVAGKRAGLAGERSGLFMEQIRIIKEMRERDEKSGRTGSEIRPRFMVWENVPGAFSSNKGNDFGAVLEETIRVVENEAPDIPMPKKGWPMAGCLYGESGGWSVAWRVFDAQFWGVPQRRRRIALVADFGGLSAPEILFERKSVSRDSEQSGTERETTSQPFAGSFGKNDSDHINFFQNTGFGYWKESFVGATLRTPCGGDSTLANLITISEQGGNQMEDGKSPMLRVETNENDSGAVALNSVVAIPGAAVYPIAYSFDPLASNSMKSKNPNSGCRVVDVSKTLDTTDPNPSKNQGGIAILQPVVYSGVQVTLPQNKSNPTPGDPCHTLNTDARNLLVYDARGNGDGAIAPTITGDHENRVTDYTAIMVEPKAYHINQRYEGIDLKGVAGALMATQSDQMQTFIVQKEPLVLAHGQANAEVCKNLSPTLNCNHEQPIVFATAVDVRNSSENTINGTLQERASNNLNSNNVVRTGSIVRRLTPLECERLQGFPDGWTDIGDWVDSKGKTRKTTDTARYKALGNSIALPSWLYVLYRLSKECGSDRTMASLFDGIGGFPLLWEHINGAGSCLWASEIEEFPMAVTRKHFSENT